MAMDHPNPERKQLVQAEEMSNGIVKTKAGFQKTNDALCGNGSQLTDRRKKEFKAVQRAQYDTFVK